MHLENKNYEIFKLPINYIQNKKELPDNLKTDLELLKTVEKNNNSMYQNLFNPTNKLGNECLQEWGKYYTSDKQFLLDSQKLYSNSTNLNYDNFIVNKMNTIWSNIKKETNFYEKYEYVDIEKLMWLNNSSKFLCLMSFYNLSSPVLNLLAPVFLCFIPFILLKMMNQKITFQNYSLLLIEQIKKHAIGRLFYSFNQVGLGQRLYLLLMVGLYFYNIYQNILTCIKFYNNTNQITDYFDNTKSYLEYTIESMKYFINNTKILKTYKKFNSSLVIYKDKLKDFYEKIKIIPKNAISPINITYIGKIMTYFYNLYENQETSQMFEFSFGFNGYVNTIYGLKNNINSKKINKVKYSKKKNKFKGLYHPSIKQNIVKNTVDLKKNIIITGPNAAGKTTILKATALNVLFCHQIGYGYFKKGNIKLYDYIHCYINIPDTSSRDSLFQAEVRRCKNILDTIENNKNLNHFCIFDELFSGTNPYEAISSGYGYLNHMSKNKNITFILTTHFMRLCKLFNDNKNIINKNMNSISKNDAIIYTYKIKNGISKIKGGISVLKQFNYSNNIIASAKNILNNLD